MLTAGVDDFRLDAVKYPYPSFITRFTRAMIDAASELQHWPPYIVGEWANGGVGDAKSLRFANNFDLYSTNILEFQLSLRLNQFVGGEAEDISQQLDPQGLDAFLQRACQRSKAGIPGRASHSADDAVLVAVNRGPAAEIVLPIPAGFRTGRHPGVLADVAENRGSELFETEKDATLVLGPLGPPWVRASTR